LKGTAMGIYSSGQFIGAFLGGAAGGWIYGEWGAMWVFVFAAAIAASWVLLALFMAQPRYWSNLLLSLQGIDQAQGEAFSRQLLAINGIEEVRLHFEETAAYLKVDQQQLDREQLAALLNQWQG
jgi:MFS family permease